MPPRRLEKGKSREEWHEQDEEVIAQGLGGVNLEPELDTPRDGRPQKKSKKDTVKQDQAMKSQRKKENKSQNEGTRRSQRKTLKPLAYWRGERYVYGTRRTEDYSGPVLVPPVKEVIHIPEEPCVPLSKKRKRLTSRLRSRSRGIEPVKDEIPPVLPVANREEGLDDKTESNCIVLHYDTMEGVERRIVWTAKMVQPRAAAENGWLFEKIFGDDEFISAGQLIIPPKGCRPNKGAKDNTYVFYVIEGAVNFKIHRTSMVVATGGMFMAPRGNIYTIENICNRDARLVFAKARKVDMNTDDIAAKESQAAETQGGRSSSVGALPNGRAASLAAFPLSE